MLLLLMELLKDWPCTVNGGDLRTRIVGITENSSQVVAGFIFVARKGSDVDGTTFIEDAVRRGAACIIIDRQDLNGLPTEIPVVVVPDCKKFISYASARLSGNPSNKLKIVAVTGTNGKTTVTHFIGQLLKGLGIRSAVIGTTGIFVDGLKIEYGTPSMTTLPSDYLHPLLKRFEDDGITYVIMEASSLGLSTNRLDDCKIDVGILLNVGKDHYDEHGGKSAYVNAKKKLFYMANKMIINRDDEQVVEMGNSVTKPLIYFGEDCVADILVPKENVQLSVLGHYNHMNAMAAISALVVLGFELNKILKLTNFLVLPEGRLQRIERDGVTVFIDYAHTPDALEVVLNTLAKACYGKLITVFGCGGNRDSGKRREMGEIAVLFSSIVIVTSDNPRNENPARIISDIMEGFGGDCSAVEAIPDRKNAIRKAIFTAAPGDFVLIAGKGHEQTQHTAEGLFPFSDYMEAEQALAEKTYSHYKEIN